MEVCPYHENQTQATAALATRAEVHADQIADLYDKHTETMRLLNEINLCMKTTTKEMRLGFERLEGIIADLSKTIDKQYEYIESMIVEQKGIIEDMQRRIGKLEEFEWFRKKMTWARDNLPWFVFYILFAGIIALMLFHSVEEGFIRLYTKLVK